MFGERQSTGRLFHTAHVVSLDAFTAVLPDQLLACSLQAAVASLYSKRQKSNHLSEIISCFLRNRLDFHVKFNVFICYNLITRDYNCNHGKVIGFFCGDQPH